MKNIRFILILCVLVIAFFTFKKVKISFHCTARTEVVNIIYNGQKGLNWDLNNVEIISTDYEKDKVYIDESFTGYLEFDKNNTIEIYAVRYSDGDLLVTINSTTNNNQIGTIQEEETGIKTKLANKTKITWKKSEINKSKRNNIVIPVVGKVLLGKTPMLGEGKRDPVLYYGDVILRGHPYLSTRLFEISKHKLEKGVEFQITKYSKSEPYSLGYMALDKDEGFYMVVDTLAYEGIVKDYKKIYRGKGYTISATIFSRIKNDTVIQAFWLSILVLFSILELRRNIFNLKRKEQK